MSIKFKKPSAKEMAAAGEKFKALSGKTIHQAMADSHTVMAAQKAVRASHVSGGLFKSPEESHHHPDTQVRADALSTRSTHELAKAYDSVTGKHGGDMIAASKDPVFKGIAGELKARGLSSLNHLEAAKSDPDYQGPKETGIRGGVYHMSASGQKVYEKK